MNLKMAEDQIGQLSSGLDEVDQQVNKDKFLCSLAYVFHGLAYKLCELQSARLL